MSIHVKKSHTNASENLFILKKLLIGSPVPHHLYCSGTFLSKLRCTLCNAENPLHSTQFNEKDEKNDKHFQKTD